MTALPNSFPSALITAFDSQSGKKQGAFAICDMLISKRYGQLVIHSNLNSNIMIYPPPSNFIGMYFYLHYINMTITLYIL